MSKNVYIYILIMAVVTYAIRALPLTLIRGKIKNRFIQSFLYYIPYVTLSVMTFPAIMYATRLVGIIAAWRGANLFKVAVSCCVVVIALELFLPLF